MAEMSEVFWGMFITTMVGFILALGKICYKSKCSQVDLCCMKITRNIDAEVTEDLAGNETQTSQKKSISFSDLEIGDLSKNNEESKK